jgi:hydroxylaminobenzene mutase
MALFLFALLVGLVVQRFSVPRLGLSVHLLGIMQGLFLTVLGLLWPRVNLTRTWSQTAHWLAIYGCVAAWTSNLLAAVWGGSSILPLASVQVRSTVLQNAIVNAGLRSAAISLVAAMLLILWGLRTFEAVRSDK